LEYDKKEFDYTETDSIFNSKLVSLENQDVPNYNTVDSVNFKLDISDFSTSDKNEDEDNYSPQKIDINSADLATLIKLPGIGEKTAQRIIKFRDTKKKINNLDELLKVKGIGKSKLRELKKFLIIE
jgi:competence protein ComEA